MKPRTKGGSNDPTVDLLLLLSKAVQERDDARKEIKNLLAGDWTPEQYHTLRNLMKLEIASDLLDAFVDGVKHGKRGLPDWVDKEEADSYIRKLKNENSTLQ